LEIFTLLFEDDMNMKTNKFVEFNGDELYLPHKLKTLIDVTTMNNFVLIMCAKLFYTINPPPLNSIFFT